MIGEILNTENYNSVIGYCRGIVTFVKERSPDVNGTSRGTLVAGGVGAVLVLGVVVKGKDLRHRFFAWLNATCQKQKDENYEAYRTELFLPMAEIESHIPELQEKNAIKILEIGVGSGVNLKHYPVGSHLICVDPNPYFDEYFNDNKKDFPNIKSEEIIVAPGECMDMIPTASVDAVVVSLVFCSVQSVEQCLKEIKRVLVPGGKFFFMEHIQEWDIGAHGTRRRIQTIFTCTGFWPFLFDGCHLNRDPLTAIQAAGFSSVNYKKFYAPIPLKFFLVVSPHLSGVATV